MELEVGEYVRMKSGIIGRVLRKSNVVYSNSTKYLVQWSESKAYFIGTTRIEKHSRKLAELVKVGDYVNGERITSINKDPFIKGQINLWTDVHGTDSLGNRYKVKIINDNIESILTREQFMEMSYKVGE